MAEPQGPILVFEGDAGVCAFLTSGEAVGHDYGEARLSLEFFDVTGRRLHPAKNGPGDLQVESEEDRSADARQRARQLLELAVQRPKKEVPEKFLSALSDLLKREPDLTFDQFVEELADFQSRVDSGDVILSRGTWGHYATSAHH